MGTSVGGNLGQINIQVNTSVSFGTTECHSHITQAHIFPRALILKLLGYFLQRTLGGKKKPLWNWFWFPGTFIQGSLSVLTSTFGAAWFQWCAAVGLWELGSKLSHCQRQGLSGTLFICLSRRLLPPAIPQECCATQLINVCQAIWDPQMQSAR